MIVTNIPSPDHIQRAVDFFRKAGLERLLLKPGARILLLPLCQLLQWQTASSATSDIYMIENPQVFEELIACRAETAPTSPNTKHYHQQLSVHQAGLA